jgi:hypothetical protein
VEGKDAGGDLRLPASMMILGSGLCVMKQPPDAMSTATRSLTVLTLGVG